MNLRWLLLCLALGACTQTVQSAPIMPEAPTPAVTPLEFNFPATETASLGEALRLWSTNYYTPVYDAAADGTPDALPLLNARNEPISPPLTRANWCNVALQGTAMIRSGGSATAYVVADWEGAEQTNCDEFLGNLSTSIKVRSRRSRYQTVDHQYGCGVENMPLMPFRSIAVDRTLIPYRSVLYVPALRGLTFVLEGRTLTHDGYMFAADRGGAIVGNHIDFFSANQRSSPFPTVVTSNETRTFEAYRVPDTHPAAVALRAAHAEPC